jgi:RND superfamily putative drug exporter
VGSLIERRSHLVWISSVIVLALLALGVTQLNAKGLSDSDYILSDTIDSKVGTQIVDQHFPGGGSSPAVLIAKSSQADQVATVAEAVPGVAQVVPYTGTEGPPGAGDPKVVDGLVQYSVILDANPASQEAQATIVKLRNAVHAVPGADAKVGGATAIALDFNATAASDRNLLPLLLFVVLAVVAVLLRAIVAPVLLVATVVLSYLAAIGVSALVFEHLFGFPGVDSTFPLHTFVFLVALGVDYNIFLITRVREESVLHGTKRGMLVGLMATGGVISSAGIVLAATFAALAVVPLVLLIELAFTVAFGVLVDTLLVRTLLVPALIYDVGRFVWWPGPLFMGARRALPPEPAMPRRFLKIRSAF